MIRIVARTQEALDKAAATLTFTELTVYIPNDYTTRVIGKGGSLIQDLINKCGILRVAVLKEDMIPEECVKNNITPFVLIGLESKLQSAKALIDYQISYLQQEETLEAQFKTLQTEIKKTRGHFVNTDGETDRVTDSESGLKSDLSIKIPTSWAVPEFPPTEDENESKKIQKSSNRPGSARNNNRNRRNQNTDTEYTDTEAYQSDAGPPSFAQLLNPNARSPRAKKPVENRANGDSNKIMEKSEKNQPQVDANNNIVGNGDNNNNNNNNNMAKGSYKKQQYNNNKQNNNYNSNNSGDKPLPQRTNNNKRQNRNKYSNRQQQAQSAQ
jgi:vacuolar-type H+-ATPase subunit I/STV1